MQAEGNKSLLAPDIVESLATVSGLRTSRITNIDSSENSRLYIARNRLWIGMLKAQSISDQF